MNKHRKHANLTRREYGNMAPCEVAIVGTKCSVIKELVQEVALKLHQHFKLAYADASHSKNEAPPVPDQLTFHDSGILESTSDYQMNSYLDKIKFAGYDLVFMNGNHYPGARQVLILDEEKEASVLKRLDQLDNIQFLVNLNYKSHIFDFLSEKYPEVKNLNVYSIDDIEGISRHISKLIDQNTATVQGLVLAGGKSMRMGQDKGLLDYFGKSQREYTTELLEKLNLKTFLSVRKEQNVAREQVIEDTFIGLGPFGAICSAFQKDPNKAWLALATDLPYVDEKLIRLLLSQRDPSKIATAFKGKQKDFPEPLITIWEPKAYPLMLQFLAQGISCPRKVLINSDVKIIEVQDEFIINVNTPEEFTAVKKDLEK